MNTRNAICVKICGLTNFDDARVSVEAGADLLGFILYPKSPRYIVPEQIAEIIQAIRDWRLENKLAFQSAIRGALWAPQSAIKTVGVFVNESVEHILDILDQTGLDYAQLHGDETPEMLAQLQGRAFKALRPLNAEAALGDAGRFASLGPVQGPSLFVDAYDPKAYGGTGKTANWHAAAAVAQRYAGLLLAGGLTPENVAEAIHKVQPWGVDVSSGVETAPRWKDHGKVRAFVNKVKGNIPNLD